MCEYNSEQMHFTFYYRPIAMTIYQAELHVYAIARLFPIINVQYLPGPTGQTHRSFICTKCTPYVYSSWAQMSNG